MSKLAIILSLIFGALSLLAGLQCQFRLKPEIATFDSRAMEAMAAENFVASNEAMSQVSTLSQDLKRYAITTISQRTPRCSTSRFQRTKKESPPLDRPRSFPHRILTGRLPAIVVTPRNPKPAHQYRSEHPFPLSFHHSSLDPPPSPRTDRKALRPAPSNAKPQ